MRILEVDIERQRIEPLQCILAHTHINSMGPAKSSMSAVDRYRCRHICNDSLVVVAPRCTRLPPVQRHARASLRALPRRPHRVIPVQLLRPARLHQTEAVVAESNSTVGGLWRDTSTQPRLLRRESTISFITSKELRHQHPTHRLRRSLRLLPHQCRLCREKCRDRDHEQRFLRTEEHGFRRRPQRSCP